MDYEEFYIRQAQIVSLNRSIKECGMCVGMNCQNLTESSPGFGSVMSPCMVVGQSLCKDCMKTQVPFTRGSGRLIDTALNNYGATRMNDVFITNLVHCHPPGNRASKKEEKDNCVEFLKAEICIVRPRLLIALGNDARQGLKALGFRFSKVEGAKTRTSSTIMTAFDCKDGKVELLSMWLRHPASFLYKPDPTAEKLWVDRLGKAIVYAREKCSK